MIPWYRRKFVKFMLNKRKIIVPKKLIDLAKKTLSVPVGIVCAHHESTMVSAK